MNEKKSLFPEVSHPRFHPHSLTFVSSDTFTTFWHHLWLWGVCRSWSANSPFPQTSSSLSCMPLFNLPTIPCIDSMPCQTLPSFFLRDIIQLFIMPTFYHIYESMITSACMCIVSLMVQLNLFFYPQMLMGFSLCLVPPDVCVCECVGVVWVLFLHGCSSFRLCEIQGHVSSCAFCMYVFLLHTCERSDISLPFFLLRSR